MNNYITPYGTIKKKLVVNLRQDTCGCTYKTIVTMLYTRLNAPVSGCPSFCIGAVIWNMSAAEQCASRGASITMSKCDIKIY